MKILNLIRKVYLASLIIQTASTISIRGQIILMDDYEFKGTVTLNDQLSLVNTNPLQPASFLFGTFDDPLNPGTLIGGFDTQLTTSGELDLVLRNPNGSWNWWTSAVDGTDSTLVMRVTHGGMLVLHGSDTQSQVVESIHLIPGLSGDQSKILIDGESVLTSANNGSIDFGVESIASGTGAIASGYGSTASGTFATSWGGVDEYIWGGTASGSASTAWGYYTQASSDIATAWGNVSIASNFAATAWGSESQALGYNSTAWGEASIASESGATSWGGIYYGYPGGTASGEGSTAWGVGSIASGAASTASGVWTMATASGAMAWGGSVNTLNVSSSSGGYATGIASTAWGIETSASEMAATAWGEWASASGRRSVAWGFSSTAAGVNSTAFGDSTIASAEASVAAGMFTSATENASTALGARTYASADSSMAIGFDTIASSSASLALGTYNVGAASPLEPLSNYVEDPVISINLDPEVAVIEVGNGTSESDRRNAMTLLRNGTLRTNNWIETKVGLRTPPQGDLEMGDFTSGTNPADIDPALGLAYPAP